MQVVKNELALDNLRELCIEQIRNLHIFNADISRKCRMRLIRENLRKAYYEASTVEEIPEIFERFLDRSIQQSAYIGNDPNRVDKTPLSFAKQESLLEQYRKGSIEARNEILVHYQNLIYKIAMKWSNNASELDELVQIGNLKMLQVMDKYNPNLGTSFYNYISVVLEREFSRTFNNNNSRGISFPIIDYTLLYEIEKIQQSILKATGERISFKKALDLSSRKEHAKSTEKIDAMERFYSLKEASDLYGEIVEDGELNTLESTICDGSLPLEEYYFLMELREKVHKSLASLTPTERKYIVSLFQITDKPLEISSTSPNFIKVQEDVANEFGVTRSAVNFLVNKAIDKMRIRLSHYYKDLY